jgi:hypothetical protein
VLKLKILYVIVSSLFNTFAKKKRSEKTGFSGKVMSLTTLLNPRTHDRDYSTHQLPGTVFVENAVKAIAAYYYGAVVHSGTGDDAEFVALERERRQLPDNPTVV